MATVVAPALSANGGGPVRRPRPELRRRLYAEAGQLFLENGGEADGGYDQTTIEQITQRSGISISTFFRYFSSKADVIYVDMPITVELHLAWTRQRLMHSKAMQAVVEASTAQLTYTMADQLDAERVHRALNSDSFMTRRGEFRPLWREKLAALLAASHDLAGRPEHYPKTISALGLMIHELTLSSWKASGFARDMLDCISDALSTIRAITLELPADLVADLNIGAKEIKLTPAQRRRLAQRRQIVEEAGRIFEEHGGEAGGGHDKTTVEEIARRSEISMRTFFRYFNSKTDVIYLDMQQVIEEHLGLARLWLARLSPAEALLTASLVQFRDSIGNPIHAERIMRSLGSDTFIQRRASFRYEWKSQLADLIRPLLPKGKEAGIKALGLADVTLEVRDRALELWRIGDGGIPIEKCFQQASCEFRNVSSELPRKPDPKLDSRRFPQELPELSDDADP